jgi:hypothetical protein
VTGAPLGDLAAEEIRGRAEALAATLDVVPQLTDADLAWASLPALSLVSLSDLIDNPRVAALATEISATIDELTGDASADRVRGREALRANLGRLDAEIPPPPTSRPAPVALAGLADLARWLVAREARVIGATVAIDIPTEPEGDVPRPIGGAPLDALVHAIRSAIHHGTPDGGALRLIVSSEPDARVLVLSDRGNRAATNVTRRPDLGGDRGTSLRAAHSRVIALGGELSASAGAWGGTTVTIRVPVPSGRGQRHA